ncbi:MAG: hypothetical protein EPO32_12360 [Anaerolineae bacterium]|nr:MAG: hypothetical protein EPO32_12360 [Anaerolineae bacterium]
MNLNDDFNDNFDDNALNNQQADQFADLDDGGAAYPEERPSRRRSGLNMPRLSLGSLTANPLLLAGIAFVLGLLLGWFGIGWGIWPITWTDAAAADLRADLRQEWLRMTIDSYTLTQDGTAFSTRLGSLEDKLAEEYQKVVTDPRGLNQNALQQVGVVVGSGGQVVAPVATNPDTGQADPNAAAPDAGAEGGTPYTLILVSCAITLVLGGALVFMYLRTIGRSRNRAGGPAPQTHAQAARQYTDQIEQTDFTALGQAAPVAQWMTTFLIGDDLFDDSFSIDAAAGEFLGECGLGIADTIGVGDPKRVTAFEVWLFDKNDIQTVTKVIMSSHVYNDSATRDRLSAKGEPVLARPGAEAILETETLQMVARVVDMAYGTGALPSESFFERVTLELAVWQK